IYTVEEHQLPSFISEIHFGFLSGNHYVGTTNVGHCSKIEIVFDGRPEQSQWKIRAEWIDKNGRVTVSEKTYDKHLREFGIQEQQSPPNITNK
ncbi:MAG: hypothetical protein ACI4RM_04955, partial [Ruminococcus sp.]